MRLLAQMKKGGPARARYDLLKPAEEKTFDLPGMTAVAVGPKASPRYRRGDQKNAGRRLRSA